ncbi:hypothetical protein BDN70DRAFT_900238 [Pholiota conissans]|uniref:Uncharacterized protein n=1 Tax=Pholiota conissans TaxID=109636 RepID=A0A9P6CT99_9AGAR|nr:hypothetical protein BDN70DRAFT_900238 [Pholiota conissans]
MVMTDDPRPWTTTTTSRTGGQTAYGHDHGLWPIAADDHDYGQLTTSDGGGQRVCKASAEVMWARREDEAVERQARTKWQAGDGAWILAMRVDSDVVETIGMCRQEVVAEPNWAVNSVNGSVSECHPQHWLRIH